MNGEYVVGTFFPALGVQPAIGRLIGAQDDEVGRGDPAVAVLSWSVLAEAIQSGSVDSQQADRC